MASLSVCRWLVLPLILAQGLRAEPSLGMIRAHGESFVVAQAVAAYVLRPQGGCRLHLLLFDGEDGLEERVRAWDGRDLDPRTTGARATLALIIPQGFAWETSWRGEYRPVASELRVAAGTWQADLAPALPFTVVIREPWRVQVQGRLADPPQGLEIEIRANLQVITVRP